MKFLFIINRDLTHSYPLDERDAIKFQWKIIQRKLNCLEKILKGNRLTLSHL